jgi:hypothetical protein
LQNNEISLKDAKKIVDNLDINCHISFIWWESFLFPNFIELLKYIDSKWITYEITTNWTLIEKYIKKINKLKNLKSIIFSIDYFWIKQDKHRNFNNLFKKTIKIIKIINKNIDININTVIFTETKLRDILKLHIFFEKLKISKHYLLVYSSYNKKDFYNSKIKINNLKIQNYENKNLNYSNLNNKAINIYKHIYFLNKKHKFSIKIFLLPKYLINNNNSCKHLEWQIRINENWNITICHFINNEFDSLINNKLSTLLKNINSYNIMKKNIKNLFPLDICKNCCSRI